MRDKFSRHLKRFNLIFSETNTAYHEISLKLGLSDSASIILYTICINGESCLLSDICKMSQLRKQTVNSALRKLEEEGIIYLKSADGRKKTVFLTEKGKQLCENTVYHIIEIENQVFGSWSREDMEAYMELSERYLKEFKEKTKLVKGCRGGKNKS